MSIPLDKNYAERLADPEDRRVVRVALTDKGRELHGAIENYISQRPAIARALINSSQILFADEPTASLDAASAKVVLELFRNLNRELGHTIVMVTHEPDDEKYVDRVIWLKDGLVERENESSDTEPASVFLEPEPAVITNN